ncbi:MAG: hypothetical protein NC915_02635 [Candidatus Omnitrophica bacterium]|nr:hypothetical protein [Candidatus Omnitrophota bacterium]
MISLIKSIRKKYENDNWSCDPKDRKLQENQPFPSILGEIEIEKEIYEKLYETSQ